MIVGDDPRLNQIPGRFQSITNHQSTGVISEDEAQRNLYKMALVGIRDIGIAGCPGIGEVKAKTAVSRMRRKSEASCWQLIVEQYEKALQTDKDNRDPTDLAITQTRLVRLLKHGEYDVANRVVEHWQPPVNSQQLIPV